MSELINGDAGRIGFLLKGDYSADSTYDFLDVVYYNGSSYVAKKETTGNVPTENNEHWHIFAMGATGDFASKAIYGDTAISLGRVQDSSAGENSIAYGKLLKATGIRSISFGANNESSGEQSMSVGYDNFSIGKDSFSFGEHLYSINNYTFSEGCGNIAAGSGSHVEGAQNISGAKYILKIASYDTSAKTFTFDDTFTGFSESFSQLAVGIRLHIANVNYINDASVYTVVSVGSDGKSVVVNENIPTSNFEAYLATIIKNSGNYVACHSEGRKNISCGSYAHSEGYMTKAIDYYAHSEGIETEAGYEAHSEGYGTVASGIRSHAEGYKTEALDDQHAQGHCNDISKASKGTHIGTSSGTAFVIGNGNNTTPSNAVRIDYNGKLWCKEAYSSTGADYAELFEWADGNPDNEDRRGYFVTVEGEKIKKAQAGDYILGIISGNPSVIGNTDMEWYGQFMRDEFGTFIKENHKETIKEPVIDEEGNVTEEEKEVDVEFYKVNQDYDPDAPYTFRLDRPEWDAVGMIGVLPVRDDGTCEVGKFCKCADGGVATLAAERGFDTYMVIDRVTENIVSVILK